MYSELPRADVRELRRYVDLPFELSEGDGALRGWFEVHEGRPEAATLDVSLRAVALRLDKRVEALEFEEVEGRFDARKKGDRIAIEARGFGFVTGDGIRWPKGNLSVAWVHPEGEDVTSGEFSADRLDIGVMAGIAGRVPLGAALRALLADVHPQGVITQLNARWDGPIDAPAHYRVKGKLTGLSLSAHAGERHDAVGRPGLRNATVQLDAGEAGGEARIGLEQGVVELPGVFDEPALPFDRLDAKLDWKIERRPGAAPNITVRVREASFANPDAEGELSATWRTGSGEGMARGGRFPGVLELDGRIGKARAARTVRYLPLGLPDSVRSYVSRSVLDGTIERGFVPGPRRPLGLSLSWRQVGPRGRVPGRGQGRRPRLRLHPGRGAGVAAGRGRQPELAVAHRRFRRADHRQDAARDPQRPGSPRRRRLDRSAGRDPAAGRPRPLRDRGHGARPAGRDAALREYDAGRPLDGARARDRQRQRQCRPQARPHCPARRSGRDQGQGQPRAHRQRRAHDARHAAARRRQGADRFHPERVHRRRRATRASSAAT